MKKIILLITLFFVSLTSQATILSIELNQDSYQVGDVLTADFVISEIEEDGFGFQKLLASFNFNMAWSNPIIEYSSVTFGSMLDVASDPLDYSDQYLDVMADSLLLNETSFALSEELFAAQDGLTSFVLASVDFTVTGNGSGVFQLTTKDPDSTFGDDWGGAFTDVNLLEKSYSVTSNNPVDVPEPASIILVLMGLMLLVRQQKIN
jgi:hypothetical protein